jgi:hypothetical protein
MSRLFLLDFNVQIPAPEAESRLHIQPLTLSAASGALHHTWDRRLETELRVYRTQI